MARKQQYQSISEKLLQKMATCWGMLKRNAKYIRFSSTININQKIKVMSGVKLSLLGKDTQELSKPRNVPAIDVSKIT